MADVVFYATKLILALISWKTGKPFTDQTNSDGHGFNQQVWRIEGEGGTADPLNHRFNRDVGLELPGCCFGVLIQWNDGMEWNDAYSFTHFLQHEASYSDHGGWYYSSKHGSSAVKNII